MTGDLLVKESSNSSSGLVNSRKKTGSGSMEGTNGILMVPGATFLGSNEQKNYVM